MLRYDINTALDRLQINATEGAWKVEEGHDEVQGDSVIVKNERTAVIELIETNINLDSCQKRFFFNPNPETSEKKINII